MSREDVWKEAIPMNEKTDRFAELEHLNESHPTWKGTPAGDHRLSASRWRAQAYIRKLNGHSNAWEGWVPLGQIVLQGVPGEA
jgi:hypothetical protein